MTTSDMLTHSWLLVSDQDEAKGKKKGQYADNIKVRLSLKELLNVSSDWKDVNKKNPTGGPAFGGGLPMDF